MNNITNEKPRKKGDTCGTGSADLSVSVENNSYLVSIYVFLCCVMFRLVSFFYIMAFLSFEFDYTFIIFHIFNTKRTRKILSLEMEC